MKLKDRLLLALAPPLAALLIRLLHLTIRTETIGDENLRSFWEQNERVIIPFWHDQLLLMVFGYPGKHAKLLISSSNDGELLSQTMKYFEHDTVRGSSSRGGRAAFREMLNLCKQNADLILTPDGPTGPRHELKDGVVQLARMSKRPVVPMAFVSSRGHRFNSWDCFLLPYPFGRGVFSFGKPVRYDKEEGVEGFRDRLLQSMAENQQRAEARLEEFGVSAV